ncbi:MAG TPA: hypothetical protein VJ948_12170 [Acidimicrobiia bacterium]|nr:hypothetical protein [Acidimicrobiia bacterium]
MAPVADGWQRLEIYRQRYDIEGLLKDMPDLTNSMQRRRVRRNALTRRRVELVAETSRVDAELEAIDRELEGSRATWDLLIDDVIERVRLTHGEGWSPTPVHGFRVWTIAGNTIKGNQTPWVSPALSAVCLRGVPGEDIPHSMARCGPPACGIYAVKDLDMFPPEVASGMINRSVVGVVAYVGKVVEHTSGYRGRHATAIAVSAVSDGVRIATSDPGQISALFEDPAAALRRWGRDDEPDRDMTRGFLESILKEETQWT